MAAKIWVVDDEDAVREALEAMMRQLNYETRTFAKGEDALSAFESDKPDVVVTDVRMPGMSGLELTRRLLELDPDLIVMILTGYPSIPDAVEAIKGGATDFLAKPCRIEELRMRMNRALENRELEARFKRTRFMAWAVILSLPVWFVLGMVLMHFLSR